MPFPLAHPAATLPLRRWCPQYFDFPALVVGSLTPDLATSIDDLEYFSHTLLGTFAFCLPIGLLTLWIFHRVRLPTVSTLPNPHQAALLRLCTGPPNSWAHIIISLLLGSWLHIVWDLFTHDHSWLVNHVALLSFPLAGVAVNHLCWLLSTLAGSASLFAMYLSLLRKEHPGPWPFSPRERRAYILWLCIFTLPLAGAVPLALHEAAPAYSTSVLIRYLAMYYMGCAYLTLALAGFFFRLRTNTGGVL